MNKKKIIILIIAMLFITGCGNKKYIIDDKGNPLKYEATGQMLENNLLCSPSKDTEVYKLYKENEKQLVFKLEELPNCNNFKLSSTKSKSIWEHVVVKSTAWVILKIGKIVKNLGVSVMIVGLLIRIILMPLQIKTTKQSQNMKKATPEIQKIERKYKDKTDNESMMAKSQEMMLVYKKYKVNPVSSCITAFIQLPIFLAFLQAIYRIPVIYEQKLLGWNLGMTPSVGISKGHYSYIALLILIILSTFFSFKYSMSQTPQMGDDSKKQTNTMLYVMMGIITLASFSLPTAIALYWIVTNAFISVQTFITTKLLDDNKKSKVKVKVGKKNGKNK